MAILVDTPKLILSVKAAPIANPSAKLCMASPIITIIASVGIPRKKTATNKARTVELQRLKPSWLVYPSTHSWIPMIPYIKTSVVKFLHLCFHAVIFTFYF